MVKGELSPLGNILTLRKAVQFQVLHFNFFGLTEGLTILGSSKKATCLRGLEAARPNGRNPKRIKNNYYCFGKD